MGKQSRTLAGRLDAQAELEKHKNLYQHLTQSLFPAKHFLSLMKSKPDSPTKNLDSQKVSCIKAGSWNKE
jgi:hypothetical protein